MAIQGYALYARLPVALQHAAVSFRGLQIQRRHYDRGFADRLREAEARASWSADAIVEYRNARLRAFLREVVPAVPFYAERFREAGVRPEDVRTIDDLSRLPLLAKGTVQERARELRSRAIPDRDVIVRHTSGTTGAGLGMATTLRGLQEQEAAYWRFRRWHGIQLGTWCGYFGSTPIVPVDQGRPPFWRINSPGREIFFSTNHMAPKTLPAYVSELRRRRPPWLHGYPSALALLAGHLLESEADRGYQPRWVTTGAETLAPRQAEVIERAFGVPPRQRYTMAENVAGASECERGVLHVDEDLSAVELLPGPSEDSFRVVGTNFANPAMPLIRYELADLVRPAEAPCDCGRPGRSLAAVDGRLEDYVVLADGRLVGRVSIMFQRLHHVLEAQVRQTEPGAITIRLVPGKGYSEADERTLREDVRRRLGADMRVTVETADRLPRGPSGKLRFVVSDVRGAAHVALGRVPATRSMSRQAG